MGDYQKPVTDVQQAVPVAGEGFARELMKEFYLSPSFDPKANRPADTVQAAIEFAWNEFHRLTFTEPARKADRLGEGAISDEQINDAIRHGFGDRFANAEQRDRLIAALNNLRANPSADEIPLVLSEIMAILQPDVLRERIAVLERENRNYAKTMDIIGQLPAAFPDPTHTREAEELRHTLDGLELTEDGYSLRVAYDGDAADDGRAIVVGGETVVTFADSDEGEAVREAILKIMGKSA